MVDGGLVHIVVVAGTAGIDGVGHRKQVEQRLSDGIDTPDWNLVVGEARRASLDAVARAGERRIANEDQASLVVTGLREVSRALERRRKTPQVERTRVGALQQVLRPEEKQLLP